MIVSMKRTVAWAAGALLMVVACSSSSRPPAGTSSGEANDGGTSGPNATVACGAATCENAFCCQNVADAGIGCASGATTCRGGDDLRLECDDPGDCPAGQMEREILRKATAFFAKETT
jgi:hypothetical protein